MTDNPHITPEMVEAADIMSEYLVRPIEDLPEQWIRMIATADKMGRDPRDVARKLCYLRSAIER